MTDRTTASPNVSNAARRAVSLEYATLGWNTVEAVVAIASGVVAGSVALMAFGIDSGIELVSATVVVVRLRALISGGEPDEAKERLALRVVAVCFFALAAYVVIDTTVSLTMADHPSTSLSGIGVTVAALIVMPALAVSKRRGATRLADAALASPAALLAADASETMLCAALSVTTLVGVGLNAALGWWWADPVASLAVVYFAVEEGREAWAGEVCCDD
ncbi:MAG: cation transporter [Actinomycetota bacterium]|nr:cation transporter [Actinomycetota bacterium]